MKISFLTGAVTLALTALLATAAFAGGGEHEKHGRHLTVKPDELEWSPVGSMPPGAKAAVLEGSPGEAGDFTMRLKFPADYKIPVHKHPQVERFTVLEGTIYFAVGETFDRNKAEALGPGSLKVMDAGVPMYGFTKGEPVVIQLNGQGPWGIEYLDPADDPRKANR